MYAEPIQDLIEELGRLPGVGPKSAQRIAFHLLSIPPVEANRLALAIESAKAKVRFCGRCFNLAESDLCEVCQDPRRTDAMICVVEDPRDVVAVERTGEFRGRYHVLHGCINPIEGIGPDQLRVGELLSRLGAAGAHGSEDAEGAVEEVIVCTNPTIEGEATAMYLARLLSPLGVSVSRLASGLPVGGDLEYADEVTLGRALIGRHRIDVS